MAPKIVELHQGSVNTKLHSRIADDICFKLNVLLAELETKEKHLPDAETSPDDFQKALSGKLKSPFQKLLTAQMWVKLQMELRRLQAISVRR